MRIHCVSTAVIVAAISMVVPLPVRSATASSPGISPNVFGSIALPVANSRYSARWARVLHDARPQSLRTLVSPARGHDRGQQASFVNASLNHRLSYRYDTHPSGDHWATASETLAKSAGDCEDFVITKMQALRSLGVPAEDLYMTIGTDAAVGAVHAVLLVRQGGRFWVLDNRRDRVIAQESYRDFYPILTFSRDRTWLHGYKRGTTPAAVRALDTARIARLGNLPIGNSRGSATKSSAG